MSKSHQDSFASRQKGSSQGRLSGQPFRGGKLAMPGSINKGMAMPYNTPSQYGAPPGSGLLPLSVPLFAAANPQTAAQPGNSVPYQITVSFNSPTQAPASPHVNQLVQSRMSSMYSHHPNQTNPYKDAPPPYTPYVEIPPPSANLHRQQSSNTQAEDFDTVGKLDSQRFKKENQGRGRGSRMRGNFSKSCGNLSSSHKYRVADEKHNDSAHPDPQGCGQGSAKRGGNFPSYHGNKGKSTSRDQSSYQMDKKTVNDSDDNISEKSFSGNQYDRDSSHNKRGRGERRGRGFSNWRGRRSGDSRRGSESNFARENEAESNEESSGEYSDEDFDVNSKKSWSGKDSHQGRSGNQRERGLRGGYRAMNGKRGASGGDHSRGQTRKSAPHSFHDKESDVHGRENNQEGQARKQAKQKVPSVRQSSKVQDLCVTLHFKMCFENAAVLKSHVESALVFPNMADFALSFDEFRLRRRDNEANCKFTITAKNLGLAKECVKIMVTALISKLDTFIKFDFEESDSCDFGNSEKLSSCPSDKDGRSADMKTGNMPKKPNWKKKCDVQAKADECEANKNKTIPAPVPTTVAFSVEKFFSTPTGFKTFLRNATSVLPLDLEIVEASVVLSDQTSKCCIQAKSKADARKITQLFNELQKKTQLRMTYTTFKTDEETTSKENDVKVKLNLAKSALTLKKVELLQNHERKISYLKTELLPVLEQSLLKSSKKAETDCNALEDRVLLAEKQMEVFLACYKELYTKLEKLDSSCKAEDITRLQTLFEMEFDRLISALPVYAHRDDILRQVKSNQVSIITGETGCGKSTQIAQYLFDAGYASEGVIVCTQPYHLSTVTLAEKVAKELSVKVGSLVGYKSNLSSKANSKTRILFTTDHCLLNEYIEDPGFKKYSCIIVDEAHKHSMYTDLLFGMIKYCIPHRTSDDLKVVILSSQTESGVFGKYFRTCQELPISRRHFDVNVSFSFTIDLFSEDSSGDFCGYEEKAIVKALEIHAEEGEGDILIFLSSPIETIRCCQEFERRCKGDTNFKCLPLHEQLPPEELKKIFLSLPKGQRKIFFATKFAETSFNVEGIKYVIDTGMTSETKYDAEQKVNLTKTCQINRRSARFRKNCAGLSIDGKCYHLYSKKSFDGLAMASIPEILRVHLEKAVLKIYELGIKVKSFEFLQYPSETAMSLTIDTLKQYGAIFSDQITDTGKWISKLPFDPKLGFLICEAKKNDLLYDGVVLAAIISLGSDFSFRNFSETDNEVEARNSRFFGFVKMDCFAWLQVYKELSSMPKEHKAHWCRERSVNYKLINYVRQCVEEIRSILLKNFNLNIGNEFSDQENALVTLKKLHLKSKCPHFATL